MKLKMFALYDEALEAYGAPMVYTTKGQATREFTDQVNTKDSPLNKHPEHYSLNYLGDYNNITGQFENEGPIQVAKAGDVITQ